MKLTAGIPTVFGNPGFGRRSVTAVLALAFLALGLSASAASAATPVMGTVSNVFSTTVHVTGTIEDPVGETYWRFDVSSDGGTEWTAAEGSSTDPNPVPPGGDQEINVTLTGLMPATEYLVRFATFDLGTEAEDISAGPNPSFTTLAAPPPPNVSIEPVTVFTDTTATFKGHVDSPGSTDPAAEVNWEFHCTPACPGSLSGPAVAAGDSSDVEAQATDLEPNTTYEVELIATNVGGSVAKAGPESFKTTAVGPVAETVPAFALGNGTEALLGAKINPKNSATTYWFEYGLGPAGTSTYEHSFPATEDASAGSGGQRIFQTQQIEELTPGTQYHFRVIAENALGKVEGEDLGFETASPLPFPGTCPNAKLRVETNSAALAECRAYEMTSDPDKNGGDASSAQATIPDGSRVAYFSGSSFAHPATSNAVSSYVAQRNASGWTTRSMTPPVAVTGLGVPGLSTFADFTSDLSKAISISRSGAVEMGDHDVAQNIFLTNIEGATHWVTEPPTPVANISDKLYVGRSADGTHIVFATQQQFTDEAQGNGGIWEWVEGKIRFVSFEPDGSLFPSDIPMVLGTGSNENQTLGSGFGGTLPEPTVVSADGNRIFFGDGNRRLFVREEGDRTVEVALSQRQGSVGQAAINPVRFAGAANDGSRAYFTNIDQLTDDATPGGGLYAYNLETKKLKFISAGATGPAGAEFSGTSLITADGEAAYFTAGAQLIPGQGVPGERNLYRSDADGLAFVATLGGEPLAGAGGEVVVPQATPDGRLFSFESARRLTAFDNAGHTEIYLYDAGHGSLSCVSCSPDGHAPTGNASLASEGAAFPTARTHGIAEDGHIFFQTTDALLPEDINGMKDIYEYRDGNVALISTGTSKYPSTFWTATNDGSNVFFTTRDSLVGQDIDGGATDVYDARVGGGFPAPPPPTPCEGETCQGKAAPSPAFQGPATTSTNGKGNANGRKHKSCKRKSKKQKARCGPKQKKHQARKHQAKKASKSGRGK